MEPGRLFPAQTCRNGFPYMLQHTVSAFRAQRENVCGRVYQGRGWSNHVPWVRSALVGASQTPSNSPPLNGRQPACEDVPRRCPFTDEIARLWLERPAAVAIEKAFCYSIVILGAWDCGAL